MVALSNIFNNPSKMLCTEEHRWFVGRLWHSSILYWCIALHYILISFRTAFLVYEGITASLLRAASAVTFNYALTSSATIAELATIAEFEPRPSAAQRLAPWLQAHPLHQLCIPEKDAFLVLFSTHKPAAREEPGPAGLPAIIPSYTETAVQVKVKKYIDSYKQRSGRSSCAVGLWMLKRTSNAFFGAAELVLGTGPQRAWVQTQLLPLMDFSA